MNKSNSPLLDIRDLCVSFGETPPIFDAVKKMNLTVNPSEIVGLIGESGSGKTTAAHSILGLVDGYPGIVEGEAYFENKPMLPKTSTFIKRKNAKIIKRFSAYQKHQRKLNQSILGKDIAAIFQEPKSALDPYINIKSHIMEAIKRGNPKQQNPEKVGIELLSQVGIVDGEKVWYQYPHQLSGGMAQRVMIAMALSCSPKLIIADEPTTALDVTTQAKLLDLFLQFKHKRNLSILIISHDIGVIREVADRVYVMYKGEIVEKGPVQEIIHQPRHPYTKKLLHAFYRISGMV